MKLLYLLRHAKAVQADSKTDDADRALAETGVESCLLLGEYIKKQKLAPDLVLCSTALRTQQTCENVLGAAGLKPAVRYEKKLYLASPGEIYQEIQKVSSSVNSLMIIGHNPGLHSLSIKLAEPPADNDGLEEKFPTCALAIIACNIDSWPQLAPDCGMLQHFITPAHLR